MTSEITKGAPKFRSERQEAEFWDTHDSTDHLDEFEDDPDTIFVRPETGIIEVGSQTWRDLVREARRRRTTPARLVNRWLREKLSSAQ